MQIFLALQSDARLESGRMRIFAMVEIRSYHFFSRNITRIASRQPAHTATLAA